MANLSVNSLTGKKNDDDEDDDAIGAAFLGINRNIVKTAHEPKPPKDYQDSSINVVDAADKQKQAKKVQKPVIRTGPIISVGKKDDDEKSAASDDKNANKNKKKDDNDKK